MQALRGMIRCWSFNLAARRVAMYAGASVDGAEIEHAIVYFPDDVKRELDLINGALLRHIVFVLDAESHMVRAYMDGRRIAAVEYRHSDQITACEEMVNGTDYYIAFLHRAPRSHDYSGDIQQFRLYAGTALTDEQVKSRSIQPATLNPRPSTSQPSSSHSQPVSLNCES